MRVKNAITSDIIEFKINKKKGVVVALFTDNNGNIFRGKAKCHPTEEWNEEEGKKVAFVRLYNKIAEKALKKYL